MVIAAVVIAFCTWYIPILESKLRERNDEKYQLELAQKDKELKKLNQDYQELKIVAEPNKLVFNSKKILRNENQFILTIQFKPSKNQRFGMLAFVAKLPENSNERILDFWPTKGSAFEHGSDSKQISKNGREAKLIYSLLGSIFPSIDLTLSGSTEVIVSGNNGLESLIFNVK